VTEHFAALVAQADAFFERVFRRVGDRMRCTAGCSSCCSGGLSVTAIEAAAIREHLSGCEPVVINPGPGCAALDGEGRCQIYAARPLLCRTHGVPLKAPVARGRRLPVISSCELNFACEGDLETVEADCRLDQQTLVAKLWTIDAAWSDSRDEPRNRRLRIREVLEKPGGSEDG
jgi:hypothetical protein